jgi:hypothetical protein
MKFIVSENAMRMTINYLKRMQEFAEQSGHREAETMFKVEFNLLKTVRESD